MELIRDDFHPNLTFGKWFYDRKYLAEVLEDTDLHLEAGGTKVPGATAIPRGRYRMRLSMSRRFGKIMPEILNVPEFTGVRAHGGNDEHDTEGCPLLGAVRLSNKVRDCKAVNERLILIMQAAEQRGEEIWLDVK